MISLEECDRIERSLNLAIGGEGYRSEPPRTRLVFQEMTPQANAIVLQFVRQGRQFQVIVGGR